MSQNPSTTLSPGRTRFSVQLDIGSARHQKLDFQQIQTHPRIDLGKPLPELDDPEFPLFRRILTDPEKGTTQIEERTQPLQRSRVSTPNPEPARRPPQTTIAGEEIHPLLLKYPFAPRPCPVTPEPEIPVAFRRERSFLPTPTPDPEAADDDSFASPFTIAEMDTASIPPPKRRRSSRRITFRSPRTIHSIHDLFAHYKVWITLLAGFQLMTSAQISRAVRFTLKLDGSGGPLTLSAFAFLVTASLIALHPYRGRDHREFAIPLTLIAAATGFLSFCAKIHSLITSA